jgi:hypothetical protein
LCEQGIQHPVANYWIAYSVAFESDERVIPVPIGRAKFGIFGQRVNEAELRHYLFPKREGRERLFEFFAYGLANAQWSARNFSAYLNALGIPDESYEALEFEHYVLFDVPPQWLDARGIIAGEPPAP